MRARRTSIFTSKSYILSAHRENSTLSSPFQNRQVDSFYQASPFQIITYNLANELDKQIVINRCNLAIEYTPQFELISQTRQEITIKIKEYPLQLHQWLTKKEALFKVNIVLGIYLAFLQLVDIYGLFSLDPNMMKVNQKQQVAIWINKNFATLQPDQILPKNTVYMSQFTKTFLRIFKCCLPNRPILETLNDPKQLINELAKIKRKEEMHKNCHEFIKHDSKLNRSKISNKSQFIRTTQTLNSIPLLQSQSINIFCKSNFTQKENQRRLHGLSPLRKQQENMMTSLQKLNRAIEFKNKCNLPSQNILLKKNFSCIENQKNHDIKDRETQNLSLCTTGVLFKRYLMYNTSKYKKGNKSTIENKNNNQQKNYSDENKQVFGSEVDQFDQNGFVQNTILERYNTQDISSYLKGDKDEIFQQIKFRKMSSCTNEKTDKNSSKNLQRKSRCGRKTFLETDNLNFSFQKNDFNFNNETQQKLKNSFPYKTSSTLNSLRQSNQDQYQYQIFSKNQQQNFNACSLRSFVAEGQKQNDKQIEKTKIVEINELQNDFNNIFSMSNSGVYNQEKEKKMNEIINQFQDLFF